MTNFEIIISGAGTFIVGLALYLFKKIDSIPGRSEFELNSKLLTNEINHNQAEIEELKSNSKLQVEELKLANKEMIEKFEKSFHHISKKLDALVLNQNK